MMLELMREHIGDRDLAKEGLTLLWNLAWDLGIFFLHTYISNLFNCMCVGVCVHAHVCALRGVHVRLI